MKALYVLLILASITLIALGFFAMMVARFVLLELGASETFAMASAILELFAIFVGFIGYKRRAKISAILIIASLPMLAWSVLMYDKPTHISLDEVFAFWAIYCVGLIILSVLGFRGKTKDKEVDWDEELLDDLL